MRICWRRESPRRESTSSATSWRILCVERKRRWTGPRCSTTNGVSAGAFAYATMHRDFNVDQAESLARGLEVIERVQERISRFGFEERLARMGNLKRLPPVGYVDSLRPQRDAALVLTDSAGLQENSTVFQTSCLTMRPNTERPVTVEERTATIVNLDAELAASQTDDILAGRFKTGGIPERWDGRDAERTVEVLEAL